MGQAASMGSLLLAGGEPGKRFALPHAMVMLHQPSGGAQVRPRLSGEQVHFADVSLQRHDHAAEFV